MITRFKIFEKNYWEDTYLLGSTYVYGMDSKYTTSMFTIINYLNGDLYWDENNNFKGVDNPYNIDFIEFLKEIFIGKTITFKSVNNPHNPVLTGKVIGVDYYLYHNDEFYISVEFDNHNKHLIQNNNMIVIRVYDADKKPLHQEVKIKKEANKYNI
jgi:hypothetical protein